MLISDVIYWIMMHSQFMWWSLTPKWLYLEMGLKEVIKGQWSHKYEGRVS